MKVIKIISKKIEEEIADAKSYAEMAVEYRDEYPALSQTLYDISLQEVGHMNMLHNAVADIIKAYRETEGEPPADMMAVYDYLHKEQMQKVFEAKMVQAMYKEASSGE